MTAESGTQQNVEIMNSTEEAISSNKFVAIAQDLWASIDEKEMEDMVWSKLDRDSQDLTEKAAVELTNLLKLRRTVNFEAKKKAGPGGTISEDAHATIGRINNIIDKGLSTAMVQPALISYCVYEIKAIKEELKLEKSKPRGQFGGKTHREKDLEDELERANNFRDFIESKKTAGDSA